MFLHFHAFVHFMMCTLNNYKFHENLLLISAHCHCSLLTITIHLIHYIKVIYSV